MLTIDDQLQSQVVELIQRLPSLSEDRHDGTGQSLDNNNCDDEFVHHAFEMTDLLSTHLRIEKNLCLVASIAAQSYDPIGVLQYGSFKQKLLVGDSKLLIIDCHGSLERTKIFIWLLH